MSANRASWATRCFVAESTELAVNFGPEAPFSTDETLDETLESPLQVRNAPRGFRSSVVSELPRLWDNDASTSSLSLSHARSQGLGCPSALATQSSQPVTVAPSYTNDDKQRTGKNLHSLFKLFLLGMPSDYL